MRRRGRFALVGVTFLAWAGGMVTSATGSGVVSGPSGSHADGSPPGTFVLTQKMSDAATFVDVSNVVRGANGLASTHVYFVERNPQKSNEGPVYFNDFLLVYDCKAETFAIKSGFEFGDDFAFRFILNVMPEAKPWTVSQKPKLSSIYGFDVVCGAHQSPNSVGDKQPWTALAASLLADLRSR